MKKNIALDKLMEALSPPSLSNIFHTDFTATALRESVYLLPSSVD